MTRYTPDPRQLAPEDREAIRRRCVEHTNPDRRRAPDFGLAGIFAAAVFAVALSGGLALTAGKWWIETVEGEME